jgi:hypothetical protein
MKRTTAQEVLAFIDAARRLPNSTEKETYVNFLVSQYELRCSVTVIHADNTVISDLSTKTDFDINSTTDATLVEIANTHALIK